MRFSDLDFLADASPLMLIAIVVLVALIVG
jgi:hypothetical protein